MLIFNKLRFLFINPSPTGMSSGINHLKWLESYSNILISEIEEISQSINDPSIADSLVKILELIQINQQLQGLYTIYMMTSLKQSEMEIDDQLNEIAGYLESIVLSRQREAENLRKIQ